ncbi:MAG: hypothetical protein HZC42_14495 [Candidatus Eisenbacteria bacterium]|nr:hypothetical protein [Candidatus Eisenbacteria bacterium]
MLRKEDFVEIQARVGGVASVATVWVTDGLRNGPYEWRLWGTDSLGVSGSVVVSLTVANRR